jgi:hypothetical protein
MKLLRGFSIIKPTARCRLCGNSDYKDFMVWRFGMGFCNEKEIAEYLDQYHYF